VFVQPQRPAQKLLHPVAEAATPGVDAVLQIPQLVLFRWRLRL